MLNEALPELVNFTFCVIGPKFRLVGDKTATGPIAFREGMLFDCDVNPGLTESRLGSVPTCPPHATTSIDAVATAAIR